MASADGTHTGLASPIAQFPQYPFELSHPTQPPDEGNESLDAKSFMPKVGSLAPQFTAKAVVDGRIKELSSQHYQAAGEWLILVFIPMAWSFICPTEIRAFSKRHQEFQACDCSVVFLSTDSEYALRAWAAHPEADGGLQHVQLPLASDRNLQISRAFGVLLPAAGVAQRALFFIDAAGIVRHAAVNDANGKALPLADRDLATADAALGRIASDVGAMDAPRPLDSPMASPSLYALMQNEEDPMDGRGRAVWNAGG